MLLEEGYFRLDKPTLEKGEPGKNQGTCECSVQGKKNTSILGVNSRRFVGLHRTIHFSFFSITGQGIDLITVILNGLPWKCTKIIVSALRLHLSTAFQTLLLTMMATPFFIRDSCPQ